MSAAQDLADRAAAIAGGDPRAALALVERAIKAAREEGRPAAEATAHRAGALALRELGDLAAAESRARIAVAVASRGGAVQAEAEARMILAYLLGARGRVRAALSQADRAAAALEGLPAARLASQRALILQEAGRLDEALAGYGVALPVLRRFGDTRWQARALNNRGLANAYSGRLADAESDLAAGRALFAELGMAKSVADSDLNLGFLAARRGDAPAALESYERAEEAMVRLGVPVWRLLICRFEVLIAVGLTGEARQAAERAVDLLEQSDNASDLAEARLLVAQVALAEGDAEWARKAARAARAAFGRQNRDGWALMARFVALRADEMGGTAAGRLRREAGDIAEALAAAGWRIAELDARLVAGRAALRSGDLNGARTELAAAAAARRAGPLELRVRAWHAAALLRDAAGDRRGTLAALRAGLELVDRNRAGLGATDLRAHVGTHGAALAGKGVELALAGGRPIELLRWVERRRARTATLRPVRPPDEPELAAALAEVRRLSAAEITAQLAGTTPPPAGNLRAAERRVVTASRTARSALHRGGSAPPRSAELVDALDGAVLVEFVVDGKQLIAVTVRARHYRIHRLGSVAETYSQAAAAQFALRRLAYGVGSARSMGVLREAAARAGAALDELLIAPLGREIGDRPVVIIPTGSLHPVPWALLPGLASRSVRIAPSAATWLSASRVPAADPFGRIVVAAGPRLAAAEDEARAVQGHYRKVELLLGEEATVPAVLAALDGAEQAHVAAHGALRTDNPLFSALELADGPLTVYDLERLGSAPRVVVLPACQSGSSAVTAGDEVMGLVAALLALGARTVIAPVLPVADVATAPLMDALHARLARGDSPAIALAAVRASAEESDRGSVAAAAAFTCFGA